MNGTREMWVLPLSKNEVLNDMFGNVQRWLSGKGFICRVNDSRQSIGRCYARADEIGTHFGITEDFQSVEIGSVTVRERDSTQQVRFSELEAFFICFYESAKFQVRTFCGSPSKNRVLEPFATIKHPIWLEFSEQSLWDRLC